MNFDSREFVKELSMELISGFDRAAQATTPGLKGSARENEVRKKLENILPSGVGVGTGCVIDYLGNVSKQQDVILFEKDLCPIFSINETPESTYYPCEGVIAVGEIKTTIGKKEIEDSFSKIASVKKLKRLALKSKSILVPDETVSFRKYLNTLAMAGTLDEEFNQDIKATDQIYGFILCGDFSVKMNTLYGHILDQLKIFDKNQLPNIIISLKNEIFSPYNHITNTICASVMDGSGYVHGSNESGSFEYLLARLYRIINSGRTVEASIFERYLIKNTDTMQLLPKSIISIK